MGNVVRVLVVDDSALVRQILVQGLGRDPEIEVVATAPDPFVARDRIVEMEPDVMTLDVEMPRMDGVEFLRRLLPQHPLPVVMVSSLTQRGKQITMDALEAGAVDFVAKPTADVGRALPAMMGELCAKVKTAATVRVEALRRPAATHRQALTAPAALSESTDKVVAIGASTGGTEAVREVIRRLPADCPGVLVVQHMPAGFTRTFADRLDQDCALKVTEACSGDRIMAGHALIAPGGMQTRVQRIGGVYRVTCEPGEKVCGHCPSVEAMMQSVAAQVGANAVGVMLTGMGADGADGLLAMRQAGAHTLGQDQATSIVYGMPKVAFERGGVENVLPLGDIAQGILNALCAVTPRSR